MGNEGTYVALGLKVWKAQIERADKLFGSLSSEEVLRDTDAWFPKMTFAMVTPSRVGALNGVSAADCPSGTGPAERWSRSPAGT